jgi:cleavage and polyadenylation specificity factor subunit 2
VTGRVTSLASSIIPILEPVASVSPNVSPGKPAVRGGRILGSRPSVTLPHSTMIGELKLTALKSRLASVGVQAELIGEGVLICGAGANTKGAVDKETLEESVAVRKTGRGKVELEGNVSDIYYIVRKEIYNLHALVAA